MASSFPTSVDVIPDAGPNLANPAHSGLHNNLRDGLRAVQAYVLAQIKAITANGWVTVDRIANGAVTDPKIKSVSYTKITPAADNTLYFSPHIDTTGHISADGNITAVKFLRAGNTGANPQFAIQQYGGTLNSQGELLFSHALVFGHRRIISCEAYYEGPSGEYYQLEVVQVNGEHVHIRKRGIAGEPAAGGKKWYGHIIYTSFAVE